MDICFSHGRISVGKSGCPFVMAKKYVTFKRPKYSEVLPHLKPMLILFIPVLALGIYKYTDKIMLGMFGLDTELGFYENAEKIVNIPLSVVFRSVQ